MPKIEYICTYCGRQDSQYVWTDGTELKCFSCGDKNVKEIEPADLAKKDVFGYNYKEKTKK